ncbi:MAG: cation:proton antiporter [Steroidobacteraceae bacterium]|jgi:CPA2 family monovalent cation:H+ antiporter-2|nr:cation:proton antiporter [Steroidobacteraceae bacterium]
MGPYFLEILLLLASAVFVVLAFQRLHVPPSLGYLLVGVLLGPHTIGPVVDTRPLEALAEFGIVFLLFTIGLNFSLGQIRALRNQVLALGTSQVAITTLVVGVLAWLAGLSVASAFVVGAVFAQSSTTIIARQLAEVNEADDRHGRLAVAMSVFQDVTAVPFLVVIPVLGMSVAASVIGAELGWAVGKALLAFLLVFVVGRWMLRPLFHLVAEQRSAELFTLTVLLVSLVAAWTTSSLGLSMAFGAFLAGMMLGETEFRHQVESTIRPFRDVLLGLFFVGIGALVDPSALPGIWHWAALGTLVLLASKILIVRQIVRAYGLEAVLAWRVGLVLAVGGEFGFALIAIALGADVIDTELGQIALTSVLFSLVIAPFLIRYNGAIARRLAGSGAAADGTGVPGAQDAAAQNLQGHVIICGYGRVGQGVAHLLDKNGFAYTALDLNPARVKDAHTAGERVFYADATERDILEALGLDRARLVVVSHGDVPATLRILQNVRASHPDLPVLVRTSDESHDDELREAGATLVVPEALEASLMIAAQALLLLEVPRSRVWHDVQEQRTSRYRLLREFFRGDALQEDAGSGDAARLHSVVLSPASPWIGRRIAELPVGGDVVVTALVRGQQRHIAPQPDTVLAVADVLVIFGVPRELEKAEAAIA